MDPSETDENSSPFLRKAEQAKRNMLRFLVVLARFRWVAARISTGCRTRRAAATLVRYFRRQPIPSSIPVRTTSRFSASVRGSPLVGFQGTRGMMGTDFVNRRVT